MRATFSRPYFLAREMRHIPAAGLPAIIPMPLNPSESPSAHPLSVLLYCIACLATIALMSALIRKRCQRQKRRKRR
jgi:hypothetical protein